MAARPPAVAWRRVWQLLLRPDWQHQRRLPGVRDRSEGGGVKKLFRSAVNVLTALSLLAFLATSAVWVSTFFMQLSLHRDADPAEDAWPPLFMSRNSMTGRVLNVHWERLAAPDPGVTFVRKTLKQEWDREAANQMSATGLADKHWSCPGLDVGVEHDARGQYRGWDVELDYWLVLAVTGALPAVAVARQGLRARRWLAARRARHRAARGTCPRCGYDLTGNVSGVCPECGTKVAATPPKTVA